MLRSKNKNVQKTKAKISLTQEELLSDVDNKDETSTTTTQKADKSLKGIYPLTLELFKQNDLHSVSLYKKAEVHKKFKKVFLFLIYKIAIIWDYKTKVLEIDMISRFDIIRQFISERVGRVKIQQNISCEGFFKAIYMVLTKAAI
jgi:hypothetical protein